jgi:hypothetical protein
MDKQDFLYPRSSYHGEFQPKYLVFNANLQEFSQSIGYIANLQTGGKISPFQAYQQIKAAYKYLKRSKKELGIGDNNSQQDI